MPQELDFRDQVKAASLSSEAGPAEDEGRPR